jgi:hypothetical protein
MRQGKTLMIGTLLGTVLLVWGAPGMLGQTTPTEKASSQPQGNAPAKNAAAKSAPVAAKGTPAKSTSTQAAPQKATGTQQQPAKSTSASAQASPAKSAAKAAPPSAQKTGGQSQPTKATTAQSSGSTAGKAPAKNSTPAPAKASVQGAQKKAAGPSAAKTQKKKAEPKPKKASATPATPGAPTQPAKEETKVARRDPFESLVGRDRAGDSGPKLPGKAGLVIGSLRLDGVVKYADGMIAVVTNPQSRTYFLREGDQLYDGRVSKISMDGVLFHEVGKDAFGKPVEREVSKRMYPSSGEMQ